VLWYKIRKINWKRQVALTAIPAELRHISSRGSAGMAVALNRSLVIYLMPHKMQEFY